MMFNRHLLQFFKFTCVTIGRSVISSYLMLDISFTFVFILILVLLILIVLFFA